MEKIEMKKLVVAAFLVAVPVFGSLNSCSVALKPEKQTAEFNPLRVAHAGGGVEKKTYTNSYEALESNYNKGFRYFELDFSFTSDDQLVCLHDWTHSFTRSFGFETESRTSLKEFEELVEKKSRFTKCTLDGLALWMEEHPDASIVTDVKEHNLKALHMIHETLPNPQRRIIPQVYQPKNFGKVKEIGFNQVIWTLYRFKGSDEEVLEWAAQFYGPFAITMPKRRVESTLPREFEKRHIPTYVHTVNSAEEFEKLVSGFGITEIYTDFLCPQ